MIFVLRECFIMNLYFEAVKNSRIEIVPIFKIMPKTPLVFWWNLCTNVNVYV